MSHTMQTQEQKGTETVMKQDAAPVFQPLADLAESDTALSLTLDMPGVGENDVEVELDKDVLTVRGKVTPVTYEGLQLAHREYVVGDYVRTFRIATEVDRDKVEATVRDGVLRVTLPKAAHRTPQKIAIKAG